MLPGPSRETVSPVRDLFVIGALLVFTNGPVLFVARRVLQNDVAFGGSVWEGPFVRPVLLATALAAVGMVVLDPFRVSGERLARPAPVAAAAVVLFTLWAVLSSYWSVDPGLTRGRAMIYIGLVALAWVVADLEPERLRRALLVVGAFAVGASLVAVVLSDSIGRDHNGDWRGIYTGRNSLAPLCALTVIVAGGAAVQSRGWARRGAAALAVAAGIAMVFTGSRTPLLALFVALAVAAVVCGARVGRERIGNRALAAAGAAGLVGLGVVVWVISRFWDESTFVQRRTIWDLVRDRIAERPLHGFGWFAVWNSDPDFTASHLLLQRGSAHSSFFEVWLGLGLIGLVPFLIVVALALRGATRAAWRAPCVGNAVWLALVVFLVVENLTESFVLWFSYNWVLLMSAALRSGGGPSPGAAEQTPRASATVSG